MYACRNRKSKNQKKGDEESKFENLKKEEIYAIYLGKTHKK